MKEQDTNDRYDHLIAIAKNKEGYINLNKLVSLGFSEGFYYKPRIDFETLKQYGKGLIIMSACLAGTIPKLILNDAPIDKICDEAMKFKNEFEDYYLEVQPASSPEQEKVNRILVTVSEIIDVPLVATCDVHFLNKEDYELHSIFIQINSSKDTQVYKDCWFKTEEEIKMVLSSQIGYDNAEEAVNNTHIVADLCNLEIELGNSYLPKFNIPDSFKDENEYLWHLILEGFKQRNLDKLPTFDQYLYWERLKEEYSIITTKGFSGYFLIVRDIIVNLCREHHIMTGDGRGSADNSLICFVIGITNVDSIQYDLNFSRFLTMERTELPDIDMDIQSSQKQHVVNLLKEKYGYDRVAQICTYQTLQAKASLDAVSKILRGTDSDYKACTYLEVTNIKKHIPDGTKLTDAYKNEKLQQYREQYPKLFTICEKLEGLPRGISVHAGGVVICPSDKDMAEFTSLALSSDKELITQYEMHNVEEVGLVKMDILATVTLDVINDTLNMVGG